MLRMTDNKIHQSPKVAFYVPAYKLDFIPGRMNLFMWRKDWLNKFITGRHSQILDRLCVCAKENALRCVGSKYSFINPK